MFQSFAGTQDPIQNRVSRMQAGGGRQHGAARRGRSSRAGWLVAERSERYSVSIADGLGHAFMALTEECTVVYLCSTPYAPGREHSVYPMDGASGIDWPGDIEPILSAKDAAAPSLFEARDSGPLPSYAACAAYAGGARSA